MALQVPGSVVSALAISATPPATGLDKLDPRFAAVLSQCKVPTTIMTQIGDAGVESSALFGCLARTEEKLTLFCKRVLNLDPEARAEDMIPVARLVMAWELGATPRGLQLLISLAAQQR